MKNPMRGIDGECATRHSQCLAKASPGLSHSRQMPSRRPNCQEIFVFVVDVLPTACDPRSFCRAYYIKIGNSQPLSRAAFQIPV